jgi:glycosyltransferase involved in cell wall biosynthesis
MCRALLEYAAFTVLASFFVAGLAVRRRYHAVVVHNPPDFLIIAGLLPKLLGARLIFDVQDRTSDLFDMRFGNRLVAGLAERGLRSIERLALRSADEVITVHEPYRRELVRSAAPRGPVHVVLNSLDERLLPRPPRPEAKRDGAFRLIYHGSLTPAYGVDLLIQAIACLPLEDPAWRLDVYGDGDCLQSLRNEADRLGIANRVFFSGAYVPLAEVLERVIEASVGVIPNRMTRLNRFALPTKLFEYVALRVPVVAADLPTIREYFSPTELTFFAPGDPNELAAALLAVARDRASAAERAERALVRYQRYRWPRNAARYCAILESSRDANG